jgi:DNA repair photolyase
MSLIYEPKGKAREYSPLALNVYSGGCDHQCDYCYCSALQRQWNGVPVPRKLDGLENEARSASRQILLCFMSDPYCKAEETHKQTLAALRVLKSNRCSVAILSKGGKRILRDLDMFKSWPDGRIKVGATLTFADKTMSSLHEPGAASPGERVETLRILYESGVKTWASIEPVIDPEQSLAIIESSLPYVDAYKVGKLNHRKNDTDWATFAMRAVNMIRAEGKALYVKDDLRKYLSDRYLTKAERDMESLALPDRPVERMLL